MKRLLVIQVFLIVVPSFVLAQASNEKGTRQGDEVKKNEQTIKQLEIEFREAKLKKDIVALERIVADDFLGINQNATPRDKPQLLALYKGKFKIDAITSGETRIRFYGDVAIVTGLDTEKVSDSKVHGQLRFTRVYARQKGHWQLVSLHMSRIAEQ